MKAPIVPIALPAKQYIMTTIMPKPSPAHISASAPCLSWKNILIMPKLVITISAVIKDKTEKSRDNKMLLILFVISKSSVESPEMKATRYKRKAVISVKKNRIIVASMISEILIPHKHPFNIDLLLFNVLFLTFAF